MLTISNLQKNFGAVQALKDASLYMEKGEIRALLGANGSGKSTLVKVLSGLNKKDGGTIVLDGKEIDIISPRKSIEYGISMAYQDLSIISKLSVAENMVIGNEPCVHGTIRKEKMIAYANEMIEKLGINAYPETIVSDIDLSNQGLVEVAKALFTNPRLLILDEITASMHHDQVERLFGFLNERVKEGLSILFVSHRFDEVYDLCAKATILREGQSVKEIENLKETSPQTLVYYMTGHKVENLEDAQQQEETCGEPVLCVKDMFIGDIVRGVSMSLAKGEIVGIAGLQGQGQGEFLRALYGAIPLGQGGIELDGRSVKIKSPADAIKKGFGFISGDREKEGIFSIRSVAENIFIVKNAMKRLLSCVGAKEEKQQAQDIMETLNVVAAGTGVPANSLSGGNQQKLVVGRWLSMKPRILLLDDPTKGVDVGARSEINTLLREMTKTGMSILFSSSDNEELLRVAQRIYVFYEGRIVRELKGNDMNGQLLAATMLGTNIGGVS
ncbi:MAG: sugar ABC transporter ATP-binding protein [Christensenella sp.]|uniref:sugar ABC transporter ATP-binding protein n=1 Tax=Christensenella sp. TaxID=1935934 RepID=UPI002B214CD4|nr:sugar ABC transporter ATP-binding protein [Christensenella sp.]MEA5002581.1 sugar ABC transporter ATP-binding protein [Christensenella sp.]